MRQALRAYKELLKLANHLPKDKRNESIVQIRTQFRQHQNEPDNTKIDELLRKASSSIGYLKIVTPKRHSDSGSKRYIYKDGKKVEESQKFVEGARHHIPDYNEAMKRHVKLVRRQHFMDR